MVDVSSFTTTNGFEAKLKCKEKFIFHNKIRFIFVCFIDAILYIFSKKYICKQFSLVYIAKT